MTTRLFFAIFFAAAGAYAQTPEPAPAAAGAPTIWTWIDFGLLIVGLAYLLGKTMPPFFRSRTQEIQKGIAEAQAIKAGAEKRAAEVEARLNRLGAEIEKFRAEAHLEMEREGERIRVEGAREIEKRQRQAEQEIETAGKNARRELQAHAAKLALDLAEQRIRGRLDQQAENALVEDFIDDLQRSRN